MILRPRCSWLTAAVAAANAGGTVNNCVAGSGSNAITYSVTGTINPVATLEVTTAISALRLSC
jgi:hypothetical protein